MAETWRQVVRGSVPVYGTGDGHVKITILAVGTASDVAAVFEDLLNHAHRLSSCRKIPSRRRSCLCAELQPVTSWKPVQTLAGEPTLWRRSPFTLLRNTIVELPDGDQLVVHDNRPDPWKTENALSIQLRLMV